MADGRVSPFLTPPDRTSPSRSSAVRCPRTALYVSSSWAASWAPVVGARRMRSMIRPRAPAIEPVPSDLFPIAYLVFRPFRELRRRYCINYCKILDNDARALRGTQPARSSRKENTSYATIQLLLHPRQTR